MKKKENAIIKNEKAAANDSQSFNKTNETFN